MCGDDKAEPRVFVENKFWASLTANQPVSYLEQLTKHTPPTALLVGVKGHRHIGRLVAALKNLNLEQESKAA